MEMLRRFRFQVDLAITGHPTVASSVSSTHRTSKAQALQDFDDFLMAMDDQLQALRDEAAGRNMTLDLSTADLDRLEKLFDLMTQGVDEDTRSSLVVSFARHLGEIVRLNYGGKWVLPLEDEKNVNFNRPVISGHSRIDRLEFAPLTVMKAYSIRKKPGTLKRAVQAQIDPKPLDIDGLMEE